MEKSSMPSKGAYLALVILGFLLGILWGLLALFPYCNMAKAINTGNTTEAWNNAKTIRLILLIGVGCNILLFFVGLSVR